MAGVSGIVHAKMDVQITNALASLLAPSVDSCVDLLEDIVNNLHCLIAHTASSGSAGPPSPSDL